MLVRLGGTAASGHAAGGSSQHDRLDLRGANMAVGPLLVAATVEATARFPVQREKWSDVYTGLVRMNGAGSGVIRFHTDVWIDLVLRAMEEELAAQFEDPLQADERRVMVANSLQHALTRYWVLSTYEVLRIVGRSEAGRVHVKLTALFERFSLVRVPLAKLQIASDRRLNDGAVMLIKVGDGPEAEPETYRSNAKVEYHPPELINDRGSVGWGLFQAATLEPVTIFRQQLSDELLGVFD
jgi:hypothetical protein